MNRQRIFALLTALTLMAVGISASAQGEAASAPVTANARVVARETVCVTAPFEGTLRPFSLNEGDAVSANEVLFSMDTTRVYAPEAGTLRAMFAEVGQDAGGVAQRYGALCAIEPTNALYIDASTANLSNSDSKNKHIHVGETLYLKAGTEKGTGLVTDVSQDTYAVEILSGDYDMNETVKCYRASDHAGDSHVGGGKVKRLNDALVTAAGRVFAIHKQVGDPVAAGDLLFEMIDGASSPDTASLDIASPINGAVGALHVLPGARVSQGQLLCEIIDLDALEMSAQVDEVYLSNASVGSALTFVFDAYPDRTFSGLVTEVKPVGRSQQNATYFDVRLSLPSDAIALPGMNATVTLFTR